jgi:hypothetical protein
MLELFILFLILSVIFVKIMGWFSIIPIWVMFLIISIVSDRMNKSKNQIT